MKLLTDFLTHLILTTTHEVSLISRISNPGSSQFFSFFFNLIFTEGAYSVSNSTLLYFVSILFLLESCQWQPNYISSLSKLGTFTYLRAWMSHPCMQWEIAFVYRRCNSKKICNGSTIYTQINGTLSINRFGASAHASSENTCATRCSNHYMIT